MPKNNGPISAEQREQICTMLKAGEQKIVIANTVGVSRMSVRRVGAAAGLCPEPKLYKHYSGGRTHSDYIRERRQAGKDAWYNDRCKRQAASGGPVEKITPHKVSEVDIFHVAARLEKALRDVRLTLVPATQWSETLAVCDEALAAYQQYWEED